MSAGPLELFLIVLVILLLFGAGRVPGIMENIAKGVWTNGGCTSWYLDSQGVNRTVWPGFTWQYWRATKDFEPAEYEIA